MAGSTLDLSSKRSYDLDEYVTKEQAAQIVGLHAKTIERAIQRGELRGFKPSGRVRIHRDDLDAWIQSTLITPTIHDI